MIEKNNENKKILFKHIDLFFHQIDHDLGQITLICEIFRNNPDLLAKIDKEFLSKFKNIISICGKKPRFLEIFLTIQKNEDDYMISNQIMVLEFFFEIFINENSNSLFSDLIFVENKYLEVNINEEINETFFFNQTDIFDYMMKLLEVFLFFKFITFFSGFGIMPKRKPYQSF